MGESHVRQPRAGIHGYGWNFVPTVPSLNPKVIRKAGKGLIGVTVSAPSELSP